MTTWQQQLSNAISDPLELAQYLNLDETATTQLAAACQQFPLRVPYAYLNKISKNNLHDPLLLQVLPQAEELITKPGYSTNPVQETEFNPAPGLLHKYPGRVLLTVTSACAIHCRYCFRKHFAYSANNPKREDWIKTLDYIKNDPSIYEVILSGGDPLSLNDQHLEFFINQLEQIPHLKILRFHSRFLVSIPDRLTENFVHLIKNCRLQVVMITHINHPNEIDDYFIKKLNLIKPYAQLLNQGVLLKNINDTVNVLRDLSFRLFDAKIIPYYLHLLDPVQGAHHFDVDIAQAKKLMHELQLCVPGYLLPKLVMEVPGKNSKQLVI